MGVSDALRQYLAVVVVGAVAAAAALALLALDSLIRARPTSAEGEPAVGPPGGAVRSPSGEPSLRPVERGLLPAPLSRWMGWARARSMRVLPVHLGSGEEAVLGLFDGVTAQASARRGIRLASAPEAAEVVVVAGVVPAACADEITALVERVPRPRYVVALDGCRPGSRREPVVLVSDLVAVDLVVDGDDLGSDDVAAALALLADEMQVEDPAGRWTGRSAALRWPMADRRP